MRRSSMYALLVVSVVSACTSAGSRATVPGQVTMKLQCLADGGFEFSLSSWSVTLPAPDSAFTWVNDPASNVEAEITAQNPKFPFNGQSHHAAHGGKARGKPVPHTPKGTYKYTVTAICSLGGAKPDTIRIDPDMIIPWSIQ